MIYNGCSEFTLGDLSYFHIYLNNTMRKTREVAR